MVLSRIAETVGWVSANSDPPGCPNSAVKSEVTPSAPQDGGEGRHVIDRRSAGADVLMHVGQGIDDESCRRCSATAARRSCAQAFGGQLRRQLPEVVDQPAVRRYRPSPSRPMPQPVATSRCGDSWNPAINPGSPRSAPATTKCIPVSVLPASRIPDEEGTGAGQETPVEHGVETRHARAEPRGS
jgi:hypothetical protein